MREIDAMNAAYEKYPEMKPYHQQLRALCFPDVAGLDVHEDFKEASFQTGIPWTFQLMFRLKGIIPDEIALHVPMFITEVHKLRNEDADYSQTFSDDPDVIFLEKQKIEYSTTSFYMAYHFVVRNKALVITIHDYRDHLYTDINGFHDDLELGHSETWTEEKSKRFDATYKAWESVPSHGGGGYWGGSEASKGFCRGNIKRDIEKTKKLIVAVKPYVSNDISLRKKTSMANKVSNIFPELS